MIAQLQIFINGEILLCTIIILITLLSLSLFFCTFCVGITRIHNTFYQSITNEMYIYFKSYAHNFFNNRNFVSFLFIMIERGLFIMNYSIMKPYSYSINNREKKLLLLYTKIILQDLLIEHVPQSNSSKILLIHRTKRSKSIFYRVTRNNIRKL